MQSTANYVDVAVSMLFLIAVNFLMYDDPGNYTDNHAAVIPPKERKIPIMLSGLAAGILLGSKPTGPLFFVLLICAILIKESINRFKPLILHLRTGDIL